jgi:hypothetical protein
MNVVEYKLQWEKKDSNGNFRRNGRKKRVIERLKNAC